MKVRKLTQIIWVTACLALAGCGRQEGAPSGTAARVASTNAPAPAATNEDYHSVTYFDRPNESQKKMEIFFKAPETPTSSSNMLIKDLRIFTYETNGATKMKLTAPDCVLDGIGSSGAKAHSPDTLKAQTGDGRFMIEGRGFAWSQEGSNVTLTISNDVVTTVQRGLLAGDTNKPAGGVIDTNDLIRIMSDRFFYDQLGGLARYDGHVRAEETRLDLSAERINLHLTTSGAVQDLQADGSIVIVDKATQSRTTADHASYSTNTSGGQLVTLTGNPHWQSADGTSDGTAREFIYDRSRETFEAREEAHFRLPAALGESGFLLLPSGGAKETAGKTNLADVYADTITLKLPPTNGPVQGMVAERNVVIVDEAGASRASGDRANYEQDTGVVVLSGNAKWESPRGSTKAETLTFDNRTKSFSAVSNAELRMPLGTLMQSRALANFVTGGKALTTNQYIEVKTSRYEYRNEAVVFHDKVAAAFTADEETVGTMDCRDLTITFKSNLVERVLADGNVRLKQPSTKNGRGTLVESAFRADRAEIQMGSNGLVRLVTAAGGVEAERTETKAGGKPETSRMSSDRLNAMFLANTNQIDLAVAEGNVKLSRGEGTGKGERLVYTGSTGTAALSGQPEVKMSSVRLVSTGEIIYDQKSGAFRANGQPQAYISVPVGGTNSFGLPGNGMRRTK